MVFQVRGARRKSKFFVVALLIAVLTACTPTQRPLKNGQGDVVVPARENHYRIEYYLKHARLAETYWNATNN
jgi:outer membrane biogenesis lipoprotein LolB